MQHACLVLLSTLNLSISQACFGDKHMLQLKKKKKKKIIIFNLDAHVTALSLCNFIRCFPQKRSKWCTFGKTKLDWVVHLLVYGPGTSDFNMGIINLYSSYWWSLDGSLDPLIKRWIFSPNKPLPSLCCCFWRERERGGVGDSNRLWTTMSLLDCFSQL